ncbi:hypothetical protein ABK040_007259 [Willaertia magna]
MLKTLQKNEKISKNKFTTTRCFHLNVARLVENKLSNKLCVVTGAGSGIGKEIATLFAKEGGQIAILDLNKVGAEKTINEIKLNSNNNINHISLEVDVTKEVQVVEAFKYIKNRTSKNVDVVVCNAGFQHIDPIDKLSFENWNKIIAVHLDAAFLCARESIKQMMSQKEGGKLIFIGSVHSKQASPWKAPYVAAKHGVVGLARSVARDYAKYNISSNVVCPGCVFTPIIERQIPEQAKLLNMTEEEVIQTMFLSGTVDGKPTTADDIAQSCLFFATKNTNAFTGQSLIASHGWHME